MSVDKDTVRRIASLARLKVPESRLEPMAGELNGIFQWVEMLNEVNIEGVPPMTSVIAHKLRWRHDEVTDGGVADADVLERVYMFAFIAVIMLVGIYPAILTDVIKLGIAPIAGLLGG